MQWGAQWWDGVTRLVLGQWSLSTMAVLGLIILAALVGWWQRGRRHLLPLQRAQRLQQEREHTLQQELLIATERGENSRQQLDGLATRLVQAEQRAQSAEQQAATLRGHLAAQEQELQVRFQALAQGALREQSQSLREHHREGVHGVVAPLQQELVGLREQLHKQRDERVQERGALGQELAQLRTLNQRLSDEAQSLSEALRSDRKRQGSWGELVLERVLEAAGLVQGREFRREVVLRTDEGQVLRPDVVIDLPEQRHLVVDAKVSLSAYQRALAEPQQAATHRKSHLSAVRAHIDSLSEKGYAKLPTLQSPEFVLLFMPVEGALDMALESEPELFSQAMRQHVVLVSPTTLAIVLRTVESLWRFQHQSDHAEEIAQRAGDMLDRFSDFIGSLEEIEKALEKASAAQHNARKRLQSGRGNLMSRAKQLQALGAKGKKPLALDAVDIAEA